MDASDELLTNRKIVLEQYDNNGELIERRSYSKDILMLFINVMSNTNHALDVARREDIDAFTPSQLKIIKRVMEYNDYFWFDQKSVNYFKKLFKMHSMEQLRFALQLSKFYSNQEPAFNTVSTSEWFMKCITFTDAINFIDNHEGIYYTVDNHGKRIFDFVACKPTKKQAQYQRNKNGARIVFLSFKDWKEHLVKEQEL
jgi:hypothetical protein